MIDISIVVPVYNEAEVLETFIDTITPILKSTGKTFEFIIVNDGSHDITIDILRDLAQSNLTIKIISLSRNFGKEAALTAGLMYAQGRAIIPIDVDLQDPPELIPQLIDLWEQGADIVNAVRIDRSHDSFFTRTTSQLFYRIHNVVAERPIPYNVGDFRLMDRRVVKAVLMMPEKDRFMKGLFDWVGFKTVSVPYARPPRAAGVSKWKPWKLWNFALGGIVASTTLPLRLWTYLGFSIAISSFIFAAFVIAKKLMYGDPVMGYASLMVAVLFLGGIQLISLGVIGEYLSRIFKETKSRPLFIVDATYNIDKH